MQTNKISIGTAQFGSKYGITNNKKVSYKEIKKILECAYYNNIRSLDTAFSYGNAEKKLGKIGVKNWQVSSKFPTIPKCHEPGKWIEKRLIETLNRLNIENLETLFVHNFNQLESCNFTKNIFFAMEKFKQKGLIKKIGISVYSPFKLKKLINEFKIDVVQSPANIFDNRIFTNEIQSFIKKNKIELEIRSIFLQGLILAKPEKIPKKFKEFISYFAKIDNISKNLNISKISLALSVLNGKKFRRIIIGVTNKKELKDIIDEFAIKKNKNS